MNCPSHAFSKRITCTSANLKGQNVVFEKPKRKRVPPRHQNHSEPRGDQLRRGSEKTMTLIASAPRRGDTTAPAAICSAIEIPIQLLRIEFGDPGGWVFSN